MKRKIRLSFVAPVSISEEVEQDLSEVMEKFELDFDMHSVPTEGDDDGD